MSTLGGFELHRLLGRGRLTEVFLARSPAGDVVVVKKLLESAAAELVEAATTAARRSMEVLHPAFARILHVSDAPPHFIAMEYVHGETLTSILSGYAEAPVSPALAARIVADAAGAMHHAHDLRGPTGEPLGLVHGALSPGSLFVSYDGQVKITDLGWTSRAVDARHVGGAQSLSRYMAPEQAIGARVDRRADVFALGAILWELLTGEHLFEASTPADLVTKITIDEIPSPRARNPEVAEKLAEITMAALTRSLVRRTTSAAVLHRDLMAYLREGGETGQLATYMRSAFADQRRERDEMLEEALSGPTSAAPAPVVAAAASPTPTPYIEIPLGEANTEPALRLPPQRPPVPAPIDSIMVDPDLLVAEPTPLPRPLPAAPPPAAPAARAPGTARAELPDEVSFSGSRNRLGVVVLLLLVIGAGAAYYYLTQMRPAAPPAPAAPETGAILVRSDPEGASIEIDGHATGKRTPARIDGLSLGAPHAVRLTLAGRRPWEEGVQALAGEGRSMHAMLAPASPSAAQDSPSAAQGSPAGDARAATRTPGKGRTGVTDDSEQGQAASSEMGFLSVQTDVRAVVSFDGRPLGRAPLFKVRVPSGNHRVRVQFDGAEESTRDARVQIRPGWEFTLRVTRE